VTVAVIGLAGRDPGRLETAVGSLLAQDEPALRIVVVDDSGTGSLAGPVAAFADERISYVANPSRLGLTGAWRRAYALAREEAPEAPYFAWASDNDVWEASWLRLLADALSTAPETVLVYGLNDAVDGAGMVVRAPWRFSTRGERIALRRFARTVRRMVAGDMVYGLFRVEALERCGVLKDVLLPDRLLLTELSLLGEFDQVPELLWHRREGAGFSLERQRGSLFGDQPPRLARLPWPVQHAVALARGGRAPYALPYLTLTYGFQAARRLGRRA
jgi:glycosyltransferase involved in cell wall biosynthesis